MPRLPTDDTPRAVPPRVPFAGELVGLGAEGGEIFAEYRDAQGARWLWSFDPRRAVGDMQRLRRLVLRTE